MSLRCLRLPVLAALAMLVLPACLEENRPDGADADATDDASDAAIESDSAADATPTTGDAAIDATADTAPAPKTFVPKCATDADCAKTYTCVQGVCVLRPDPAEIATLTDPDKDNTISAEAIQLGCVGQSVADQLQGLPAEPATVTMWGRVDRFGGGGVTADVEIAVFALDAFHPEACAGIEDLDALKACYGDEAKVGKPIAKTVSIDPDQAAANGLDVQAKAKNEEACDKHLDCPSGYECRKTNAYPYKVCLLTHGVYALEGIPTNTRLVVRARATKPGGSKWHDSYLWDIVLFSNRLDAQGAKTQPSKYVGKPTYRVNPTIVGDGQWKLVPNTMGLGQISEGNGVIGGRVRDCGVADGRGGWAIHNAKIGLGVPAEGIAFFNDNEDDTVPVKTRAATDKLGRYAAVDIAPGPNRVASAALVGGKLTSLGASDVYVIPEALMIVSLPGRVPVLSK